MADTKESPTLETEEPKTGKATDEPKDTTDLDGLMKTLESYGVKNSEDLTGKLDASQQYGQMANLLGQERQRSANLEQRLASVEQRQKAKPNTTIDEAMEYGEGQTVNIEEVIGSAIDKRLNAYTQQNAAFQKAQIKAYNKIHSDRNYDQVKTIWEQKEGDPNFLYQVNAGMINPVDAYRDMVDEYKDGLLKQSYDTLQQLQGKKPDVTPPHVETGDVPSTGNLVSTEADETLGTATIKKARNVLGERMKADESVNRSLGYDEEMAVVDGLMSAPGRELVRPSQKGPSEG